jgi:hypothetical protein
MFGFSILSEANWLNEPRLRRIALIFALLAGASLAADFWQHTSAGVTDRSGEQLGRDFVNYWSGARLAAHGHASRVYDIGAFVRYEREQTAANAYFKWYSYPPTALLLSLPLAGLGFVPALAAWLLSGLLLCTALLARTLDWHMALLATLATPAALINALWGQNGQFSAALLAGGILLLESRPSLAGLLFGLLCFKPHLAVLVPLALAARGRWRSFAAAVATVTAISAGVFVLGTMSGPASSTTLPSMPGCWSMRIRSGTACPLCLRLCGWRAAALALAMRCRPSPPSPPVG